MSESTQTSVIPGPRVIQIRLRTLALAVALPAITAIGMAAMANSSASTATNAMATFEYKVVRPGEYGEISGVERELNGWGKDGFETTEQVIIARTRTEGGKTNYRLQAGGGDFIILRRGK